MAQVIGLHDTLQSAPVMNRGALESAVAQPQAGFGETEFYPSTLEKAAVLLRGVANAHAFVDGNKRTAWVTTVIFLQLNGILVMGPTDTQVADFVDLTVVQGNASVGEIVDWLLAYCVRT
ncbi:type II toxin-antitoxin system death-on-curing family toxin [Brevibacterium sp. 50QC2O2]|uniref:type II toxin-antitoxin system death-on-curing family toxin n=1 Tax=unclassified Brevibacterium TaxID=2614124 RepID=UPI00211CB7E5|nr:type II toxin-antitoxin system death-on-curing family toxin [Brevibacterium sp. 91QC2O2]MCQ9387818.1 type II toxin-antitoxin system death-on-curing family toxin [Brevibacterium sp. 50QC2O2]